MIRFTTFLALVVGGMEAIQPAAAGVLANLPPSMFQRRQGSAPPPPPQCVSVCSSVTTVINSISSLQACPPDVCCTASFENSYFNCFSCAEAAVNVTDYTSAQATLDSLYDDCAELGIQLPVLTYPGQNPNRPLSSVVLPTSTVSSIASLPSQSISQSTFTPSTSSAPATSTTTPAQATVTSVNTPNPTSSSVSSGIRTVVEISCFNLITVAMMLGAWLYFAS